ncbi:hypothetical protein MLD38_026799 [Melastoma candidum]|uniref:Uncharacterized protein n=1 Tax=Melastoma candidum TaxID=119954 RepID=A0ACB9P075_9MYRT|nr:hypothetical protein MLD38_026799 [Melastoma candidum]
MHCLSLGVGLSTSCPFNQYTYLQQPLPLLALEPVPYELRSFLENPWVSSSERLLDLTGSVVASDYHVLLPVSILEWDGRLLGKSVLHPAISFEDHEENEVVVNLVSTDPKLLHLIKDRSSSLIHCLLV